MSASPRGPVRTLLRANPLLAFLALHIGIGAAVAAGVVALLLVGDVAGLRTLVFASDEPLVAVVMLGSGFIITFASATAGSAVMGLRDTGGTGGRRQRRPAGTMAAVAARAPSTRSRRVL